MVKAALEAIHSQQTVVSSLQALADDIAIRVDALQNDLKNAELK